MAWKTKPTRFNLKLVRSVQKALSRGQDCGMPAASYQLSITDPNAERSETYRIWLVQDDEGTCMATCPEVPGVLVFEEGERNAVMAVQAAIKQARAA